MTNTPKDAAEIASRLRRLTGLNQTQIDSLSLSLDPVQVDQINDSDLASLVNGTLPGLPLNASGGLPLGLPGATSAARFVGGTASGAPTTGQFLVRDWVVTGTGTFYVCTVAGSPGTWVQVSGGGGGGSDATTSAKGVVQLAGDLGGTAASPTVPGLASKAPLASPALTGTPTAPTAAPGTNTTQVATTAFVAAQSGTSGPLTLPTAVKAAAYTAASGDYVKTDTTSGTFAVTLPTAPSNKTVIDVGWSAGVDPVTVVCGGSDVLNKSGGSTSIVFQSVDQKLRFQYDSASNIWNVQDFLPPRGVLAAAAALSGLERDGLAAARRYGGQAVIDYTDTTPITQPWTALDTAASSNEQVSGGKLFSTGTQTAPVVDYIPLAAAMTPGTKFTFETFFDMVALGGNSAIFLGFSTAAPTSTSMSTSSADFLGVGFTSGGSTQVFVGSSYTAQITAPGNSTPFGVSAGRYAVLIVGDEQHISFSIRSTTDNTKTFTYSIPVSAFTALGVTIGRVGVSISDTRALAGHSIGPVVITVGSQQPPKTKTLAGFQVDGVAHRDIRRLGVSSASDIWRYQIPAGYDPRKPAPLALYCHAAQVTSTTAYDRPWGDVREQAMTKALGDAGFIVAAPQDGYVVGSPTTDRYGNDASMANFVDLYSYLRSHFNIGPVLIYGCSMGGQTGTNIIARRTIPNIAAAYFICPNTDLDPAFSDATYSAAVSAAFGGASITPAGHNSARRHGADFRGVPMRISAVTDDAVCPPSVHTDPFLAKIAPYTVEASKLTTATGGHLANAAYQPTDFMTFVNKYFA